MGELSGPAASTPRPARCARRSAIATAWAGRWLAPRSWPSIWRRRSSARVVRRGDADLRGVQGRSGPGAVPDDPGDVLRLRGDLDGGLALCALALGMMSDIASLEGQVHVLRKMVEIHLARRDFTTRWRCWTHRRDGRELRDRWAQAEALTRRGDVLMELGRRDEARASWQQALARSTRSSTTPPAAGRSGSCWPVRFLPPQQVPAAVDQPVATVSIARRSPPAAARTRPAAAVSIGTGS